MNTTDDQNSETKIRDPIRVTTLTRAWRRVLWWLRPSEWAVWLLGLKRSDGSSIEPGLILVQIDGLSETQLMRALENGHMPFLASLLEREHYRRHAFYSGLPSSTPAVQAELFYGVETAVPAFGFRDHRSGQLVRMFANEIATEVETELQQRAEGLLTGGSSYGNVYGGGAKHQHFCASSFGWSEFFSTVNPLKMLLVLVLNALMFFRVAALMVIESCLATLGFVRGVFSGRQFWQELIMIPARVVVVVLLRELVSIFASYDAARGVPIISLNLLGYDEQAHRRGPDSAFAHWTLKGIDRAIRRVWNAAHRGAGCEYDVWVFSDHGQEPTQPYQLIHGHSIQQVVAEFVDSRVSEPLNHSESKRIARVPSRANWVGIGWLVKLLFGEQDYDVQTRSAAVQTVTSGPVGFVYLQNEAARQVRGALAEYLVHEAGVPMVVVAGGDYVSASRQGQTRFPESGQRENHLGQQFEAEVVTPQGRFQLPDDAVQVFGAQHPFVASIAEDLVQMAAHPDAGDLLLIGWKPEGEAISFVLQNGAHAGPGSQECNGFALLPRDTSLPVSSRGYLRPNDLRLAALNFLRRPVHQPVERSFESAPDGRVRLLTYNVHACVGMDGQLSPERIARVIAQSGADIVCLQELDVGRPRSGHRDQAREIAEQLQMLHQFHPAWHVREEQFGNAILTRFPLTVRQAKGLHHHRADRSRRSAIWIEVALPGGRAFHVINAHLSIYPTEQRTQAAELVADWVQPALHEGPVVVCGDFNARPRSPTWRVFNQAMRDVESFTSAPTQATYFSPFPMGRLDHIFVAGAVDVKATQVIDSRIARVASDHLPLLVELEVDRKLKTEQQLD